MNMNHDRRDGIETIALSRRPSIVAVVVAILGLLIVVQVILVLATRPVVLPLLLVLSIAAASAAWLAVVSLDAIGPITIRMDKDGIVIGRLLGDQAVAWSDLAAVKLVPSVGTFSDDPGAALKGRLAVGLFLKSRKAPRANALDADVVVYSASESHADTLLRLVERISEFRATIGSGLADRNRRIRRAAPIAQPVAFRKKTTNV